MVVHEHESAIRARGAARTRHPQSRRHNPACHRRALTRPRVRVRPHQETISAWSTAPEREESQRGREQTRLLSPSLASASAAKQNSSNTFMSRAEAGVVGDSGLSGRLGRE